MRVLIVDDSALFRDALRDWLAGWNGFEVVAMASDGVTALHLARSEQPDLILMDLQMPGWDGFETTRRIKAEMPEVRILLMTAAGAEAFRASAIRYGAESCIAKDADQLRDALERLSNAGKGFCGAGAFRLGDSMERGGGW